jgi:HD-GYP domain-containing protein (c-di-GMP phosphodiesterase class II)
MFDDDEARVLGGLRRSLYNMRGEWEMRFADSGAEAVKALATEPVGNPLCFVRPCGGAVHPARHTQCRCTTDAAEAIPGTVGRDPSQFRPEALGKHSFQTAAWARAFALREGLPAAVAETGFLAGVLHDLGRLVFATRAVGKPSSFLHGDGYALQCDK